MSASPVSAVTPALSDSQKTALVTLLTDDDPSVYHTVRSRILAMGAEAIPWMRAHTLSSDPILRRRAAEIVTHLARQEADNRFLGFCLSHGDELDLEEGIWMLAQTQYPDINISAYQALLDTYAAEIQERLKDETAPLEVLRVINAHLFEELGFTGNQENYYDPDNSYFNRVVDRRTGNPISLCALYWLISRRLALPVAGIGMPGHFLCRFQGPSDCYFVDAFNRGKLLTRADCVKYLQQTSHGFHESFLAPVTHGRTLLRMCSNLHQIYCHLELKEDSARLQRYLVALAK
jgi:regulator of sirC expression with transglutaminase-like and TPR domain